jgi:hypothetical protein
MTVAVTPARGEAGAPGSRPPLRVPDYRDVAFYAELARATLPAVAAIAALVAIGDLRG